MFQCTNILLVFLSVSGLTDFERKKTFDLTSNILLGVFSPTGTLLLCFKYFETTNEALGDNLETKRRAYAIYFWVTLLVCIGFSEYKYTFAIPNLIYSILIGMILFAPACLMLALLALLKNTKHQNFKNTAVFE